MDFLLSTTEPARKKEQHLTFADRVVIQTCLHDKWSIRKIARELRCAPNTVRNEMKHGKVLLGGGRKVGYRAVVGQETYEAARKHCGRRCRALECGSFLDYVEQMFYDKYWPLDACFWHALRSHKFPRSKMVCTKTLYNYVTLRLLDPIKRIELPLCVRRRNKSHGTRKRKKKLGRSIEERDASVKERQEVGHWECIVDSIAPSQLPFEIRKGIELVARIKRLVVLSVRAFHLAVVPWRVGAYLLVLDAIFPKLLPGPRFVVLGTFCEALGELGATICLHLADGKGECIHKLLQELRGGKGALFLERAQAAQPRAFVDRSILLVKPQPDPKHDQPVMGPSSAHVSDERILGFRVLVWMVVRTA